jgi:hypothetical protein
MGGDKCLPNPSRDRTQDSQNAVPVLVLLRLHAAAVFAWCLCTPTQRRWKFLRVLVDLDGSNICGAASAPAPSTCAQKALDS